MHFLLGLSLLLPLVVSQAEASQRRRPNTPPIPVIPVVGTVGLDAPVNPANNALPPYNTWYYFQQLIDHNDPGLGTFTQRYAVRTPSLLLESTEVFPRYYFTAEWYQPGGPISMHFLPEKV